MKKFQGILTAVATVALAAFAQSAMAAPPSPLADFYAAGSSAQFNTFALAAANGTNPLCGNYHWTVKNGAQLIDPRNGSILPEPGNIWLVWNDAAAAGNNSGAIVCYYVSVDSIVGLRSYFANATVHIPNPSAADGGLVPYIAGTAQVPPANVISYVEGSKINFAATDIRPEDGKFASNRTLTAYGALMTGRGFTGVGYQGTSSTPWLGVPIVSSVSTASANPVDFAFVPGDTDPVTGGGTRAYKEASIGAAPVMVVVNVSNTSAGHMGDPNLAITDIGKQLLANVLLGNVGHVRSLSSAVASTSTADAALHVWVREPLSGTYNTMDFNIPNANDIAGDYAQAAGRVTGQEAGINPSNTACAGHQTSSGCGTTESGNPLFHLITPAVGGG